MTNDPIPNPKPVVSEANLSQIPNPNDRFGIWALVIGIWLLLLYGQALGFAFFNDDPSGHLRLVEEHSLVELLWSPADYPFWRPLGFVIWKLLRLVTGHYPAPAYHLVNLILHAASATLVYKIGIRLTGQPRIGLVAGLIFATHPYNFEIAYVGSIFHSLATFLVLSTLALFLCSREKSPGTRLRLASYVTLTLALLSHESAVAFILLLTALDLLFPADFPRPTFNFQPSTFNRYLPYLALTAVYLIIWRFAPKLPSAGPSLSASKVWNGLYFLQGLTFPTAPLGTLFGTWLGLGESPVPFVIIAIVTLAVAGWLMRCAGLGRLFTLALCWTAVSVLPATLALDSEYVLGSPRLFTLGSVGAAWLWSGTLTALWILDFRFWIKAHFESDNRKSKIQNLKYLLLVLALLVPAVVFVESRVSQMADGTRLIHRMSDLAARAAPDDRLLFVNLPQYAGPGKTLLPIGFLGMTLFPDYMYLPDLVRFNRGVERQVEAVVSPELRQGWYFTYGQGVDPKGLAVRAVVARKVYLFDPATWELRNFDTEPGLPGAFALAQRVRALDARAYLAEGLLNVRKTFDPGRALVLPPSGQAAVYILPSDQRLSLPESELLGEAGGLRAILVSAGRMPVPQHPSPARLGDTVRLLGYDVQVEDSSNLQSPISTPAFHSGQVLQLTLYWQATAPMAEAYTVFTHLLDPSGQVLSQADAPPGGGSYPTTDWDAGEVILDRYTLPMGSTAAPGAYNFEVGMYLPATGERLPVFDAQGIRMPDDRVLVEISRKE